MTSRIAAGPTIDRRTPWRGAVTLPLESTRSSSASVNPARVGCDTGLAADSGGTELEKLLWGGGTSCAELQAQRTTSPPQATYRGTAHLLRARQARRTSPRPTQVPAFVTRTAGGTNFAVPVNGCVYCLRLRGSQIWAARRHAERRGVVSAPEEGFDALGDGGVGMGIPCRRVARGRAPQSMGMHTTPDGDPE
ncbi:hypothetical protein AcW1_010127 [Taiwanofungus camphoratus]|nr:hypothetical protein AcV5_003022 [Antrodia cinnamomea]KAI0946756.1 hypothetical protein AcW1_010127 [Antrodia cinnamomea]